MILADSHCHLPFSGFKDFLESRLGGHTLDYYSVEQIVDRADQAGIKYIVNISTQFSEIEELSEISNKFPRVFGTIGIHPEYAKEHLETFSLNEMKRIFTEYCVKEKTVAVGEIGLDYYRDGAKEEQKKIFEFQLEIAEEFNLPVSIHTRQAWQDTMDIIDNHPNVTGSIHCFSGEPEFAERVLKTSFCFGLGGTTSFKNNKVLQNTIRNILPLDRILFETDAPFLAPTPFRGSVNEPSFIEHIAKKVAELKELDIEQVANQSMINFFRIFSKIKKD